MFGADAERVATVLCELAGLSGGQGAALREARGDAMLMGDQLRSAFVDWLASVSEDRPVVMVLEDLQWGDRPSLALVDAALGLDDAPLLVLAGARPELEQRMPRLWDGRDVTQMALRR